VLIPYLHVNLRPRGVLAENPKEFTFNKEPDSKDSHSSVDVNFADGPAHSDSDALRDCVKQVYLGKRPFPVKKSTRCNGLTSLEEDSTNQDIDFERAWRWKCLSGGNWIVQRAHQRVDITGW